MAVVAMGRYGGFELSYGSDADVLFVHDPRPGADPQEASGYALAVGNELRRLLAAPGPDPALEVDAGLRPEGKQGPLVRSLESYAAYYAKWSRVWEAQALLRADAVVGDEDLRRRFTEMVDPLRYPEGGPQPRRRRRDPPDQGAGRQRAAAARRRPQHPPQAGPRRAGRHRVDGAAAAAAARRRRCPGCAPPRPWPRSRRPATPAWSTRTTRRCWPRGGAPSAGSATPSPWSAAGRPTSCPATPGRRPRSRSRVGYSVGGSDEMVNDYLRRTRRTHAVVERIFWG